MADKLLVRVFDVGLGDCIYCRIPKAHGTGRDFHILVDCGTLSSMDLLAKAVDNLKPLLPVAEDRHHVDLLVISHEHKDHMSGFGMDLWKDFSFGAIWMNAAMDPDHPQATRATKLHAFAAEAMDKALRLNLALGPDLMEMANAMALNRDAMKALRNTLPRASGIKPAYVHAESDPAELALPLVGASISVLGPEPDIDLYYLGDPGDRSLRHTLAFIDSEFLSVESAIPDAPVESPQNLDPADFRQLRQRMLSTALAFADLDGKVCNNTSTVILIEWQGRRLLFGGDAEWDGAYKKGAKANCAWNVMWNLRRPLLEGGLSFYKVGHHGSINATPWGSTPSASRGEPLAILDAILPVSSKGQATAIVSTRRGNYATIPNTELLAEIGKRVSNTRLYDDAFRQAEVDTSVVPKFADYEKTSFGALQPLRTDLERILQAQGYVDVEL